MGGDESFQQTDELPSIREFPPKEKLAMEKEALGIYVSGHPLAEYEEQLRRKISNTSMDFLPDEEGSHHTQIEDSTKVIVGGMIAGVSVKYTRNNDKMALSHWRISRGAWRLWCSRRCMKNVRRFCRRTRYCLFTAGRVFPQMARAR